MLAGVNDTTCTKCAGRRRQSAMVMALTARRQVSSHSRTFHACADERVKARLGSLLRDRPEEGMDGASASKRRN